MTGFTARLSALLLLILGTTVTRDARAAAADHWVGTWATAPVAAVNSKDDYAEDTTVRNIVHVSIGGPSVRIVISNEFGSEELRIGAAAVGLVDNASTVKSGTSHPLTFNGQQAVGIPAGAKIVSDPVALTLPALSDLAVSLFLPGQKISTITQHGFADQTNYVARGNQAAAATLTDARSITSWPFVMAVDVTAPAGSTAIVCFGDSITDGALSTRNANARWPDVLARRLQADKKTRNVGVLNLGIGGNRLVHDITGPNALARFDRDVLSQSGVRYLVILEGINDIGRTTDPNKPDDPTTTGAILLALQQMIDRAHAHGIKVYGATLTPYAGAKYEDANGETMRAAENDFIRKSGKFDGVIDFDKATQDPAAPLKFVATADGGDHLHPSDGGYKAMGESIDLKLFEK